MRARAGLIKSAYESLVQEGTMTDADFENEVMTPARGLDRARWWIDNRDLDGADLPELLADPGTLSDGGSTDNV